MSGKIAAFASSFLLLILWLTLSSCHGDRGPQGPAALQLPYLSGGITAYNPEYSWRDPFLEISGISSVPHVELNGLTCGLREGRFANPMQFNPPDSLRSLAGDSISLDVHYTNAAGDSCQAWAHVVIPDSFHLTSPDTSIIHEIPFITGDLSLAWTPSPGADVYLANVRLSYGYADSGGSLVELIYYNEIDTALTDTAFYLSPERLFPDPAAADSFNEAFCYIGIYAQSGPWQPGEPGNITGDGLGFFYGWLYVGNYILPVVRNPY